MVKHIQIEPLQGSVSDRNGGEMMEEPMRVANNCSTEVKANKTKPESAAMNSLVILNKAVFEQRWVCKAVSLLK